MWKAAYEPGTLEVRAGADGPADRLDTPGRAVRMEVSLSRNRLPADGRAVLQAEVLLLDGQGHPAEDETVRCQILGDVSLLGLENGRPDDLTPYAEPFRTTREGSLTAYIRAGETEGEALLHFWTESGLTADQKIRLSIPRERKPARG